jgi:hypothetical protein
VTRLTARSPQCRPRRSTRVTARRTGHRPVACRDGETRRSPRAPGRRRSIHERLRRRSAPRWIEGLARCWRWREATGHSRGTGIIASSFAWDREPCTYNGGDSAPLRARSRPPAVRAVGDDRRQGQQAPEPGERERISAGAARAGRTSEPGSSGIRSAGSRKSRSSSTARSRSSTRPRRRHSGCRSTTT